MGITAAAALLILGVARSGRTVGERQEDTLFGRGKETVYLWYTDESLTAYLSSAAVKYNESHQVRVVPALEPGLEYLERINTSTLEGNVPDLYILSHDMLEKAYLAGLAGQAALAGDEAMEEAYMGTGLSAASYKDKILGYPFYFETSALLYNKTYLRDMALSQLEAEADIAEGEAAQQQADAAQEAGTLQEDMEASPEGGTEGGRVFSEEQIEAKMQQLLPTTLEDIKTFADNYDAPEQVEGVFKWDVTDIFYNYFFLGNAINMGGQGGWDTGQIDIYNENAIESMKAYQELNQFFSIDTGEINYDKVLDEFMAGKMVFTIATTDAVFKLEQAKDDGLFVYDYGIAPTPDINENIPSGSLSLTNCVVINDYSQNREAAADFARFITSEYNGILFARTGKVSAAKNVDYGYEALGEFAREYGQSVPMPKMIETSNFWVKLEVAFSQIWNGADANGKLKELSEQVMEQVTGSPYEEEYLEYAPRQEEGT